jgi:nucleotide-binding universal stress UspA family protein
MSVLVGYDGRPESRDALALAALLGRALGEPLIVACVYPPPDNTIGLTGADTGAEADFRSRAEHTAAEGRAALPHGLDASTAAVLGGSAAQGLHDLAESERPAAIVLGSSHRGALGRVLAGSVASRLFSAAPCPVAIAPRGSAGSETTVLRLVGVGFDDNPESWNALQRAAALGVAAGARLRLIHAVQPVIAPPMAPEESERLTRELRAHHELALRRATLSVSKELQAEARLVVGDAVRVLDDEGHHGLDLLVLGSRGYGPLRRVLLGSVASEVVRLAPCPVMVVPRGVEFDPTAGGMAAHDALTAT